MSQAKFSTETYQLAAGQWLKLHLKPGAVVHLASGRLTVAGPPTWLAETVSRPAATLTPGAVYIAGIAGWTTLAAHGAATVHIMQPAPPPGWWRLIKSRFGRSGLLLGIARPPDTKAAEIPVPHATSK